MASEDDVIEMNVVRRVRAVVGVCEMCLARVRVRGEVLRVGKMIGFGLYQPCGNRWSVGRVLCLHRSLL